MWLEVDLLGVGQGLLDVERMTSLRCAGPPTFSTIGHTTLEPLPK